ncbi:ankyrin repeat domain-containing protein [Candidatus Eisenbacteria bacterium]|uniref:Ankyrin repeat domain-containing protein n=1 Tax=Eiseniibacteriota bacterium TaxID=2212470 RepID=A0ABV6YL29_UNCEI
MNRDGRFRSPLCTVTMSLLLLAVSIVAVRADEIHTASRDGDLEQVRTLVETDPSAIYSADDRDCRPLHFAADTGAVEVARFLLDQGARLEDVDVDGDTPLHWAAYQGRCAIIELLLSRGAKINAQNHHEETPLLYAAKRLRYDAVELLVRNGADLEVAHDYGRTPLLHVTRERGDIRMATLLLDLGANVNARDKSDDSSLHLAAWRGFRTLVNLLLDRGAEVDVEGSQAEWMLLFAVERGLDRLYQRMTEFGKEIDVEAGRYGSLLHAASQGGSPSIVRDLVARGADLNAVDVYGFAPLHYAAVRGRTPVVRELLQRGADHKLRTGSGFSALNLAEKERHPDVLDVLRQHGVDDDMLRFPKLRGPYLGQAPPGDDASLFAPDIVARPWGEHGSITFSPDGTEAFWPNGEVPADSGYGFGTIWTSRVVNGHWTPPRIAPFANARGDDVPFFAPGGESLYFISDRPTTPGGRGGKENIWSVEREGNGWGEPHPLPPVINNMHQHWQISVAAGGSIYFNSRRGEAETGGIYVSRRINGEYSEPEFLGIDGGSPFIAPDESYMLFTRFLHPGGVHIFITFPRDGGAWSEPIDISADVHPAARGMCPIVSPNEEYLFFVWRGPNNSISWIDAGFLKDLRSKHGKG